MWNRLPGTWSEVKRWNLWPRHMFGWGGGGGGGYGSVHIFWKNNLLTRNMTSLGGNGKKGRQIHNLGAEGSKNRNLSPMSIFGMFYSISFCSPVVGHPFFPFALMTSYFRSNKILFQKMSTTIGFPIQQSGWQISSFLLYSVVKLRATNFTGFRRNNCLLHTMSSPKIFAGNAEILELWMFTP